MAGRGRPKIILDLDKARQMAVRQCTREEVAAALKVNRHTLYRNKEFCNIYEEGLAEGRMLIKIKQYEIGVTGGDKDMLKWLGKQYLNQSEQTATKHTGDIGITIVDDVKSKMKGE